MLYPVELRAHAYGSNSLASRTFPRLSRCAQTVPSCTRIRTGGDQGDYPIARGQVDVHVAEVPGREQLRPEVRVALGHDRGTVPHDGGQLLDRAPAEHPQA